MNLVVDSSVFISGLGQKDVYSNESSVFFAKAQRTGATIAIPTLAICETLLILSKQHHPKLFHIYQRLLGFYLISLDDTLIESFVNTLPAITTPLKSSDMVITVTAKIFRATLVTWDRQLLKQSIVAALTPVQWVASLSS